MKLKQREITFKPRIKLNPNKYKCLLIFSWDILGCHKVKYFFSGKYFFCPFQRHIAFHAAVDSCWDMIFYLNKVYFAAGLRGNELIIKKQHCCLWTCENLHDRTKGSAATKHRSTLNTDRRVVRRGSTAPAASFTIV